MKVFIENLMSEDVVNNMLELANYLAKQEGDMDNINVSINKGDKTLYMRFEAYTMESE